MNLLPWLRGVVRLGGALLLIALTLVGCGKTSPADLLKQGQLMMQNRDVYGAELQFQKILEQAPESQEAVQARIGLYNCYRMSEDYDSALQQLDKLLEVLGGPQTPEGFDAFREKIRMFGDMKEYDKAIQLGLETSPTLKQAPLEQRVELQMMIGMLYLDSNQRDQARQLGRGLLDKVADRPELHSRAMEVLAMSYNQDQDSRQLEQLYDDYLKRFPDSPMFLDIQFLKAKELKIMGRAEEASQLFEQTENQLKERIDKSLGEEKTNLLFKLAQMQQLRDDIELARKTLGDIVADYAGSPASAQALLTLATLDYGAGKSADAIDKLKRVISENPNTNLAQMALRQIQAINEAPPTTASLAAAAASPTLVRTEPTTASAGTSPSTPAATAR